MAKAAKVKQSDQETYRTVQICESFFLDLMQPLAVSDDTDTALNELIAAFADAGQALAASVGLVHQSEAANDYDPTLDDPLSRLQDVLQGAWFALQETPVPSVPEAARAVGFLCGLIGQAQALLARDMAVNRRGSAD